MKVIGLGHYARVGKDEFANMLIGHCEKMDPLLRVRKASLARKLKEHCFELYAWAGLRDPEFYETEEGAALREVVLPEIGKSPRQIWIDYGTPAVREQVYEHTWIKYVLHSNSDVDVLVIPDVRFFNEVDIIRDHGPSHLIKVVRPGHAPGNNKPDRELLGWGGWDNVIGHYGKLDELNSWAYAYAKWLTGQWEEPECTPAQMQERLNVEAMAMEAQNVGA